MASQHHHFLFFNVTEIGHFNPTLPLVYDLVVKHNVNVSYVVAPWRQSEVLGLDLLQSFETLVGEASSVGKFQAIDLRKIATWQWDESDSPAMNLSVATQTYQHLLAELKSGSAPFGAFGPITAVFYDPFALLGPLVATSLAVPLVCSISNTPYPPGRKNPFTDDELTELKEQSSADLRPPEWIHPQLPFALRSALCLMYTIPEVVSSSLAPDILERITFTGSMAAQPHYRSICRPRTTIALAHDPIAVAKTAQSNGQRVVFLSFGTVLPKRVRDVATFRSFVSRVFREVIEVFRRRSDLALLISLCGIDFTVDDPTSPLFGHPSNVTVFSTYTPQIEILQLVDVFVTHAGAGSLNEAMAIGVPMIVVPFGGDQGPNGAVAEALGLGVSFGYDEGKDPMTDPNRESFTPQRFEQALDFTLNESTREKSRAVAASISERGSQAATGVLSWIEQQLAA